MFSTSEDTQTDIMKRPLAPTTGLQWLFPVVVGVITLATFMPALQNDFVNFDDDKSFLTNPYYRGLGWENLKWMFSAFLMGHYVPLTWMSLGLDYVLWGMHPSGYHLTNILLHAANAVVFYFLAVTLLRLSIARDRMDLGLQISAAAAALVFAVHPLRVESVAWITERRDVLSGLFYLLAILFYIWACRGAECSRGLYWTSLVSFACALLSKSIVATLPAILLVLDVFPLRRLGNQAGWRGGQAWRVYREKIPFALLAVADSLLVFFVLHRLDVMASLDKLGILERLGLAFYGLGFYLQKTILPLGLSPLYEPPRELNLWAPDFVFTYIFVLGITLLSLRLRRRVPGLLAAWITYVITLLPVSGLFQTGPQMVADRYSYLSCLGLALLIAGGVYWSWRRVTRSWPQMWPLVPTTTVAVILSLQVLTVRQIQVWRHSLTLWQHALAVNPANGPAYNNMGLALLDEGRFLEAEKAFEKARELLPGHAEVWNHIGVAHALQKRYPDALAAFLEALKLRPDYSSACQNGRRAAEMLGLTVSELQSCGPS